MAITTVTQWALETAAELAQELAMRLPLISGGISTTFDTDGCPVLQVGTSGAGNDGGIIKVCPVTSLGSDILGTDQRVYSPHEIQIGLEKDVTGTSLGLVLLATAVAMLGASMARGTTVKVFAEDNGTAPVVGTLVAAKLKATFSPNLQFPFQTL